MSRHQPDGQELSLRVLLIERSSAQARRIHELIADSGRSRCSIHWVSGYQLALDFLRREHYDVLILDLGVSDLLSSPLATLSLLQRVAPTVPTVILNDHEDRFLAGQLLRSGAQDVLVKSELHGPLLARALAYAVERKRTEESLRTSEERFALAVRGSNDGIWDWDLRTSKTYCSPRWKAIFGYHENADFSDISSWFRRIHPRDRPRFQRELKSHLRGECDHLENEHRILHRDGGYRWVLSRGVALRDDHGRAYRLAGSLSDVTQRKAVEQQLEYAALHDTLIHLPNRAFFLERVGAAIARIGRDPAHRFAVLYIDLDRFKNVNDNLGHALGDDLLRAVARRLEGLLRPDDVVARLGGDEFGILAGDLAPDDDGSALARRVLSSLGRRYDIYGHEIYITVSVGVVIADSVHCGTEQLLRHADVAMYRAKAQGRNGYQLFDPKMHAQAVDMMRLENELRGGIDGGQLRLYYQPVVDLESGVVEGFEALVRWQHPKRGLLPPDVFVPIAEESGLIHRLGRWVLTEGCRQAGQWQRRFPRQQPISMSINLSGRELIRNDLIEMVSGLLDKCQLAPGSLRLEITESVVMDHSEVAIQRLQALRDLLVKLQLDDFGTGYCSLSYLQRIPTDTLKIDRSFISEMRLREQTAPIVEAIVSMARQLGIGVLAEGVETADQLARLRSLSCPYGQGFLFSKPVPAEEAELMLERGDRFPLHAPADGQLVS